jgi:hypothetical protein
LGSGSSPWYFNGKIWVLLTCDCGPGASSCNPVAGCVCMSGWQGDKCDADVDECNDVNNPCDNILLYRYRIMEENNLLLDILLFLLTI